jgi:4-amino-4-deoxy-L-arabinose transferase-like glycosyltransferase
MLASGNWFLPRVGGDLYGDKPPVFFWLRSPRTRAHRIGTVVVPAALHCSPRLGTLLLVYSLATRLHGRRAGLRRPSCSPAASSSSRPCVGRRSTRFLLFFSTLSLWAFCRHLLLGPDWRACFLGGLAAGIGVITKGVGFLPLLLLPIGVAMARSRWAVPPIAGGAWRWGLAPAGFLLAVSAWLLPMLAGVSLSGAPELVAYRDEILFQQTVQRYAASWHHVKPWWYFFVEVVPALWLPASALLFWLVPRWRRDWVARRGDTWLLLFWVLAVLLFFSLSPGKRGVYVLPALPALVLAASAHLDDLVARRGVGRTSLALAALLALPGLLVALGGALGVPQVATLVARAELDSTLPLQVFGFGAALVWLVAARLAPVLAWPAVLALLATCWGVGVAPQLNAQRSAATFMSGMLAKVPRGRELGLVAYKEQFLLNLDRPSFNFGHGRWREGPQEAYDASLWLAADPQRRVLLVPDALIEPCFVASSRLEAGQTSRETWWLVSGAPAAACLAKGQPGRAIAYPAPRIG